MSNRWVVNASPLILLAKIGRIDLLSNLTESFVIPAGVVREINDGPVDDPARQWLAGAGSPSIVQDPQPLAQSLVAWDLGAGETAVLTWAIQHPGFEAILDDRAARKCAIVHGDSFSRNARRDSRRAATQPHRHGAADLRRPDSSGLANRSRVASSGVKTRW